MRCWVLFCILNLAAALTLHDSSDIEAEAGRKSGPTAVDCGRTVYPCFKVNPSGKVMPRTLLPCSACYDPELLRMDLLRRHIMRTDRSALMEAFC